jgi:uncharacterized protein (PEP-CTERM system associated)
MLLCGVAALAAQAQPAAPEATTPAPATEPAPVPRAFALIPGIAFEATVLNVTERASGNGTELYARVSPGLTMANRGARLRGTLIYSGAATVRRGIEDRAGQDYLNSLSANYVLEAIEGFGFVDARANITQTQITAVGSPLSLTQTTTNRTEVRSAAISPYVRGALGGLAEYEVRAEGSATRSSRDSASDVNTQTGSFNLRSPRRGSLLGWGLSGSRQRVEFLAASSPTITDRLNAELVFQPDVDWRFTASGGRERTDVVGGIEQDFENYGAGVLWSPSPRTSFELFGEERYFGRSHRFAVSHRLQRSLFRFTSSRDLASGYDYLAQGRPVTLFELYFTQYETAIPDPVQRAQFVLALIAAQPGRTRDEIVGGGLLSTSGVTAQRRKDLFWSWTAPRLTLSANAFAVDNERVDVGGVNPASANDNARQRGYSAALGWRLTPLVTLNASGSRTMSKDTVSGLGSDLKSVSLGATGRLGPRTLGTLSARYSVLNGFAESYRESALSGSISLRF